MGRRRRALRWLVSVTVTLGVAVGAAAQNPTPEELSRAFTEKFLGLGAGSAPAPGPTPAPAAGPAPTPPAGTVRTPAPGAYPQPVLGGTPAPQDTFLGLPITPPPAPSPSVGGQPPQFVLAGVVMIGETGMALLQEPGQPGSRFVQVGESVGAYRLAAVRPDRAILNGPGGEVAVLLGGGTGAAPSRGATAPPRRAEPAAPPSASTGTPAQVSRPNLQPGAQRQAERDARRGRQTAPTPQYPPGQPSAGESQ